MKSIITYRILALLLGFTGAHNFYFQYRRRALVELAISVLSCGFFIPIAWVIALYDIATIAHENMSARTQNGKTTLQNILLNEKGYAAESVVQLADALIQGGVDVSVRSTEQETALHLIARNAGGLPGDACEHIMRALLNAGADPGALNAGKKTVLQLVLRNEGNLPSIVCERLARAILRINGGNLHVQTVSLTQKIRNAIQSKTKAASAASPLAFESTEPDSAPLWLLLKNEGKLSGEVVRRLVRLLLQTGAAPNLLNSKGERPLQYLAKDPEHICSYISRDLTHYLIEFGADTHMGDKSGNTPLHLAAAKGNYPVVEALLKDGASPSAENNKKQKPIEVTESYMVKSIFASMPKSPNPAKA